MQNEMYYLISGFGFVASILGAALIVSILRKKDKAEKKPVSTMNIILGIVGVLLVAFTVCMIVVFIKVGSIPDTLVTCVFAALAGECGIMGWIRTTKDKRQERKWQLEDEKRTEEKQKVQLTYKGGDKNG